MDRRTSQVHRAAQLYYLQDHNQADIAATMGISRASVSRLLSDARSRGIVTISLNQPTPIDSELSERVRTAFDLRDAIVVADALNDGADNDPSIGAGGIDDATAIQQVGRAGAEMLVGMVEEGQTVAISWGRTLGAMADALAPAGRAAPAGGVEVVQMLGSLGEGAPEIDGPELARRFAGAFGGTYRYVHAPAVVSSPDLCRELTAQTQIEETLRRAAEAHVCITSVGSLADPKSSLERNGYLTREERRDYAARGAVGHLLAKLIDGEGNEMEPFNSRVVALPLARLASRPWSVCLAATAAKADALLGAITAGFVNAVVVDRAAAGALLELHRGERRAAIK